jgi:glycosyltransferase involved in cell wall biosynthesis
MKDKLNILHINSYEKAGGAEQIACDLLLMPHVHASLLVKSASSKNTNVRVFKLNFVDKLFHHLDRLMIKLGYRNNFRAFFSLGEQLNFTYRKLRKTDKYIQADIIHLHNIHGNYFDLDALKHIAKDKYIVWTIHDMWPITGGEFYTYENKNFQKGIGHTPIKFLAPLQQPLVDRRQYYLDLKGEIYNSIKDKLFFVPVSNWLAAEMNLASVILPDFNIRPIYNGYNTRIFQCKKARTWTTPRVLFFNLTGESKACELFTEGLNYGASFELYVIGKRLDDPRVKFYCSYIDDRERLSDIYNDVDILIFPSKAETFGLVPLEAMACGVCVISSDATALPELVNGKVGYLFKSGSSSDLYAKLDHAISSLERSRELGMKASIHARENFNLEKMQKGYLDLYRSILNT